MTWETPMLITRKATGTTRDATTRWGSVVVNQRIYCTWQVPLCWCRLQPPIYTSIHDIAFGSTINIYELNFAKLHSTGLHDIKLIHTKFYQIHCKSSGLSIPNLAPLTMPQSQSEHNTLSGAFTSWNAGPSELGVFFPLVVMIPWITHGSASNRLVNKRFSKL